MLMRDATKFTRWSIGSRSIRRAVEASDLVTGSLIALMATVALPFSATGQRMVALPPACTIGEARSLRPVGSSARGATSLAVMPLAIPNPTQALNFLADGFVDALADRIGYGAPRIDVLGRRAYRRRGTGDSASVRPVGTETGVAYVLTG